MKPSFIRVLVFKCTPIFLIGLIPSLYFIACTLHDSDTYWNSIKNTLLGGLIGSLSMSLIFSYLIAQKYEIGIYSDSLKVPGIDGRKPIKIQIDEVVSVEHIGMLNRIVVNEIEGKKSIIPAYIYRKRDVYSMCKILNKSHNKSINSQP